MTGAIKAGVCPCCGIEYDYTELRYCSECDIDGCSHCISGKGGLVCRECSSKGMPLHLEPMLSRNGSMPHDLPQWGFEFKWDGVRALCYSIGGHLRLESRTLKDITARYPDLTNGKHPESDFIIDGEIITLNEKGIPDFRQLQSRMHLSPGKAAAKASSIPVHYYIFDILWIDGTSLLEKPYEERRTYLDSTGLDDGRCNAQSSQ